MRIALHDRVNGLSTGDQVYAALRAAIVSQLGTFVTLVSPAAVEDAAFVREALECAAIRRATERVTEVGLADLQANLAAQERAQNAGDAGAFDTLDDALHRLLAEL